MTMKHEQHIHDSMNVGAKNPAREDVQGVTDVANRMAGDRLDSTSLATRVHRAFA